MKSEKQQSSTNVNIMHEELPLSLHVHEDIDVLFEYTNMPIAFYRSEYVYIMQDERFVFLGTLKGAKQFIERNEGKYCKDFFEGVSVNKDGARNSSKLNNNMIISKNTSIDELKSKHNAASWHLKSSEVEKHTAISIEFAIAILENVYLGNTYQNISDKINELKQNLKP